MTALPGAAPPGQRQAPPSAVPTRPRRAASAQTRAEAEATPPSAQGGRRRTTSVALHPAGRPANQQPDPLPLGRTSKYEFAPGSSGEGRASLRRRSRSKRPPGTRPRGQRASAEAQGHMRRTPPAGASAPDGTQVSPPTGPPECRPPQRRRATTPEPHRVARRRRRHFGRRRPKRWSAPPGQTPPPTS